MRNKWYWLIVGVFFLTGINAQVEFPFRVELKPVEWEGIPGLHAYAYATHEGKWLVVGGRLDGLHARQPFRSFPHNQNNTSFFVIDPNVRKFTSLSHENLSPSIHEQLQATNMNFYQDGEYLVIVGGYAFSKSADDHITFPSVLVIDVPHMIQAIERKEDVTPYIQQIHDERMAVTGGNLGKLNDKFVLVGGHRFDGRYNPMGHNTYVQTYTEAIRSFRLVNESGKMTVKDYAEKTDSIHLHRRDYNLLPVVESKAIARYVLSAGVFQHWEDLPMMYPVEVGPDDVKPHVQFNQLLSNYHSAKATFFDATSGIHQYLFFGGMSQFTWKNGILNRDTLVPFVSTISLLQRSASGEFSEALLLDTMPGLRGASAEFIPLPERAAYPDGVMDRQRIAEQRTLIGHIYGGIESKLANAFSANQTDSTHADARIYEVYLIRDSTALPVQMAGIHEYSMSLQADSKKDKLIITFQLDKPHSVGYVVRTKEGTILYDNDVRKPKKGKNKLVLNTKEDLKSSAYVVTLLIDRMYYVEQEIMWK